MGEGPTRDIGPDPLAEGSMDEEEAPDSELEAEEEAADEE
jgi:hypothetical protein